PVCLAVLHLSVMTVLSHTTCPKGFHLQKQQCVDYDECEFDEDYEANPCGENAECINTEGSFYCHCADGAVLSAGTCKGKLPCSLGDRATKKYNFNMSVSMIFIVKILFFLQTVGEIYVNECVENGDICGPNAKCYNTIPYYSCICDDGFITNTGAETFRQGDNVTCRDIDECQTSNLCGQNAACVNTLGSFYCACNPGFRLRSGYAQHCGLFRLNWDGMQSESLCQADSVSCFVPRSCPSPPHLWLQRLLSMIDELLSSGALTDNRKVSTFLDLVETAMRMIGPLIKLPKIKKSSVHSVNEHPLNRVCLCVIVIGFATVSLLSYKNLEGSTDGFFSGMEKNKSFEINSKVVTAVVSNRDTSHLNEPVILTLYHLKQVRKDSNEHNHTCVYWDSTEGGGTWSARGCSVMESNADYTVCSCNHLSSFAVLMALHEIEDRFDLQLITWVGLSLSLLCLFICILTFSLVRSIQSPRTTIHLHLCISLFIANLVFLAGISRTENRLGCAVVAGLLHYFYLAAFCWMCLEGVQLFRMVVLVFNTNFKTIPMLAVGYGVPAVIVAVSAIVNAKGYGTKRHCWLNLEDAFIWSFFGPVCVIIIINIFFFLITVWKLAQKFSSLNPDLTNLRKIKAFTITAVAQLCVLGTMWIFGCFQFDEGTSAMTYLFTLLNSLQGVLLFIMHCLLSKQVREEYGSFLSSFCAPQKKKYSEFTSSQASKAQTSKSTQNTGESHI
uniref:Si:ch211-241f5.3 n=1 Tax=Myripristis murdjan TaxID=586833 RepID=A0A667XVQ2_9TELE